jgi:hypothetical protein
MKKMSTKAARVRVSRLAYRQVIARLRQIRKQQRNHDRAATNHPGKGA